MDNFSTKYYRDLSFEKTKGKKINFILAYFLYSVIIGLGNALTYYGIGAIIVFLVDGALMLGLTNMTLAIARDGNVAIDDLFSGFKNFGNALCLNFLNGLLIGLWTLLFIIPGIIKAYSYAMSFFILSDNPQMNVNDVRLKSGEMMRGNKMNLFMLDLSYIGWFLLSILTFGILLYWIIPQIKVSHALFYQDLIKSQNPQEPEQEQEVQPVA